ncbi:MAG: shikimate dehydrogenase [Pseudomonadota bacterium]
MKRKACVIGWPIEHSRSPIIHTHWLGRHGIDGRYDKVAVKPEADALCHFLKTLRQNGYVGCNVTVPHKEAAFGLLDRADPSAKAVSAANTIWMEGDLICGANTDTYGFMAHLTVTVPDWKSALVGKDQTALVLGAGGAARAIVYGLIEAGISQIVLCNRTLERAQTVARDFGQHATIKTADWSTRQAEVVRAGLIINTTTMGMNDNGDLGLDLSAAPNDCVVADIVYVPLETGLLSAAKASGLRTVDGLGMLLHQAVPGFEKWFGIRPDVTDELRQIIIADLARAA